MNLARFWPRSTVSLLICVATVAILLGAEGLRRRRDYFRSHAESHSSWVREHRGKLVYAAWMIHRGPIPFPSTDETARFEYHLELIRKYEQAARCPWLFVEPDPPDPR